MPSNVPQGREIDAVIFRIAATSVMLWIHGLYTVLFGGYLYMIKHKRDNASETARHRVFILLLTVALFILSTVFVVVYTVGSIQASLLIGKWGPDKELSLDSELPELVTLGKILPVLLNIAADCILIDRCYLIWGSRKRVAIPLIVVSVIVNGLGLVNGVTQIPVAMAEGANNSNPNETLSLVAGATWFAYLVFSTIFNVVVTILTASRIWWIHREARRHYHGFAPIGGSFLDSVVRIVLESGMLYPISMIAFLIVRLVNGFRDNVFYVDLLPVLVLSSGIAPTLLLVRAKINTKTEEYRQTISDIRFPSQPRMEVEDYAASPEIVHLIGKPAMVADDERRGGEDDDREISEQEKPGHVIRLSS